MEQYYPREEFYKFKRKVTYLIYLDIQHIHYWMDFFTMNTRKNMAQRPDTTKGKKSCGRKKVRECVDGQK